MKRERVVDDDGEAAGAAVAADADAAAAGSEESKWRTKVRELEEKLERAEKAAAAPAAVTHNADDGDNGSGSDDSGGGSGSDDDEDDSDGNRGSTAVRTPGKKERWLVDPAHLNHPSRRRCPDDPVADAKEIYRAFMGLDAAEDPIDLAGARAQAAASAAQNQQLRLAIEKLLAQNAKLSAQLSAHGDTPPRTHIQTRFSACVSGARLLKPMHGEWVLVAGSDSHVDVIADEYEASATEQVNTTASTISYWHERSAMH